MITYKWSSRRNVVKELDKIADMVRVIRDGQEEVDCDDFGCACGIFDGLLDAIHDSIQEFESYAAEREI